MNVNATIVWDSGLQSFLHSRFCQAVARLLVITMLITGIPVDYSRPAWAAPPPASSTEVAEALTVGNHTLISTARVTRTLFDFTYQATLTNASPNTFHSVTATHQSVAGHQGHRR